MNAAAPAVLVAPNINAAAAAPSIALLSMPQKVLAFGVMCLGCFLAYLDIQIVSTSIQEIGGGLSASQDELSWVQTSYLIAEIIVVPLTAWLSRVMSTRWLVAASAAGFTITSMLCSTAWDIRSMIVFRALQGFFGGSMIPTAFTAAVILFQGRHKAIAASFVTATAAVAPTLSPVIGGWVTDNWSWHWLFYINILPGMLVTVLVPILVRIDEPDLKLLKGADYPGLCSWQLASAALSTFLKRERGGIGLATARSGLALGSPRLPAHASSFAA
jgi:MFS transporter, DHA2 family, multidrug resistance protein